MKNNKIRIILISFVVILVAISVYFYFSKKKNGEESDNGSKIQLVEARKASEYKLNNKLVKNSGIVESMEQVDLKAQLSGEVLRVNVEIGQEVKQGDLLVELDHAALDAQLSQAAASISRAQSGLNQRLAGATSEDIERVKNAVTQAESALAQARVGAEASVENAEKQLELAKSALDNTDEVTEQSIGDSYDNLRLTINSTMPSVLSILVSIGDIIGEEPGDKFINDSYENSLGVKKTGSKGSAITSFKASYNNYQNIKSAQENLDLYATRTEIDNLASSMETLLNDVQAMLVKVRDMLDNTVTSAIFSETSLNQLRVRVDGAINTVSSLAKGLKGAMQAVTNAKLSKSTNQETNQLNYERALENLTQAKEQAVAGIQSAESALAIQRATYDSLIANPREVDLGALRSSINEASAAYRLIKANRDKAFIYAPFDGTISSLSVSEHDLVTPGTLLVSLVNMNGLQVTSFISERDRQLVSVGNKVILGKNIEGTVTNISPSLDVLTHKVETIIAITTPEPNIAVGQSIDVEILTNDNAVEDVYVVPLKSIIINQNSIIAYKLVEKDGSKIAESTDIEIGQIEGVMIEVLKGLSDDDLLIIEGSKEVSDGQTVKTE